LPSIRVRSFGPVKEIIGAREVEVDLGDCATLRCVLRRLSAQYGEPLTSALLQDSENGELRPRIRLLVNGRDVAGLRGVATTVGAGDVLTIYPPVSGG
jgi:molybdopterin synthase sulfur carrier subunit